MAVGAYEHWKGKNISWRVFRYVMVVSLFVSCFLAWREEHLALGKVSKERSDLEIEKARLKGQIEEKSKRLEDLRDSRKIEMPERLVQYLTDTGKTARPPAGSSQTEQSRNAPSENQGRKHLTESGPSAVGSGRPTEPPLFSDLRMTQRMVPSDKPDLPFAREITIQTSVSIQPVAVLIQCDKEIGEGHGGVGAGVYFKTKTGVLVEHPSWFLVSFESPAFTPRTPLVVTLFSKSPINALSANLVEYSWP